MTENDNTEFDEESCTNDHIIGKMYKTYIENRNRGWRWKLVNRIVITWSTVSLAFETR